MQLRVMEIKPMSEINQETQEEIGELVFVGFTAMLTPEEFQEIKNNTDKWCINVELKHKDKE